MYVNRIEYYRTYLAELERAIADGLDIRGYMAWSLLDNYEWADGFKFRFGLHYVDYTSSDRRRYAKDSARWFAEHIRNRASYRRLPVAKTSSSGDNSVSGTEGKLLWRKSATATSSLMSTGMQSDGNIDSTTTTTTTMTASTTPAESTSGSLLSRYVHIYRQLFSSAGATSKTHIDGDTLLATSSAVDRIPATQDAEKEKEKEDAAVGAYSTHTQFSLTSFIFKAFRIAFLAPLPVR